MYICIKKEYVGVGRTLEFTYGEGGARSELCIYMYVRERIRARIRDLVCK